MKKKTKLILFVILLVAAFLRLWKIDKVPVSLFGDELDVGYQAYSILKTGRDYSNNLLPLHFQSLAEWRTPLYLYSAVPTVALFGITPLGVRLPAAVFGILGVWVFSLLVRELTNNERLSLVAAAVLAFSPWHIQYSRAAFEVSLLLFLLLLGLYLFFKSFKEGKWLWVATFCLALTPWVYSTAKLFTPLLLIFLTLVYRKEFLKISKKYLSWAVIALVVIGTPIALSTLFGGGTQRFGYVSIFTDPTREQEVGVARETDARMRGEVGEGLQPTAVDKIFHNKFTFWGKNILDNYFQAFSTDFLFVSGDLNLRHSIKGMGQFYKIEAIALILGLISFFVSRTEKKKKLFIAFWVLAGVIPAAITREGGRHATRLILVLPPLVFLIAYGLTQAFKLLQSKWRLVFTAGYLGLFAVNFISYQHLLWFHNPWNSERWWHSGWRESVGEIKTIESGYDKVVISMAGEPAWIFFAAHYMYPPDKWQANFPIGNDVDLEGFGRVSHTGKFYFGSPPVGLYEWGKVLDDRTLYLANASEVKINLILEPERTPGDLRLIKAVSFPSGEPAFYLFEGVRK